MKNENFEVIIVGGSYSGLSAAMALGRALRKVLVIDAGMPANRFTPHSHNFITHDGRSPGDIAALARKQVDQYKTVKFKIGFATEARREGTNFRIVLSTGEEYVTRKIILATGIVDILPEIPGFADCWGKSVLHCPYCHGYEVRDEKTGILGNGDYAFEFGSLISNWTKSLKIYTNGPSTLTNEQRITLNRHHISIIENRIKDFSHINGLIQRINFQDGKSDSINALYTRPAFVQHSDLSSQLGCDLTDEGYIKTDPSQRTTSPGVYACGDNVTKMRTVANAVSLGTTTGMMMNKELVMEDFT